MAFQIYRFDVIKELGRESSNVVYEARDQGRDLDSPTVRLYEWTPPVDDFAAAKTSLDLWIGKLEPAEVFSVNHQLYIAGPTKEANDRVLKKLQRQGLFTGSWPVVAEETDTSVEQTAGNSVLSKSQGNESSPSGTSPSPGAMPDAQSLSKIQERNVDAPSTPIEPAVPTTSVPNGNALDTVTAHDISSADLAQRKIWGWVILVACVAGIFIYIWLIVRDTCKPGVLCVGVYGSTSLSPFYVQNAKEVQSVDVRLVEDGSKLFPFLGKSRFNVLLMPLTTVPDYRKDLQDWRIVWVPDLSSVQLFKRQEIHHRKMITLNGTFGYYLLKLYIEQACASGKLPVLQGENCYKSYEPEVHQDDTADRLVGDLGDADFVAADASLARLLRSSPEWTDFREIEDEDEQKLRDKIRSNINVLLVSPDVVLTKQKQMGNLVLFIAGLSKGNYGVKRLRSQSLEKITEMLGSALSIDMNPDKERAEKDADDILDHYESEGAHYNYLFLYHLAGRNSCPAIIESAFPSPKNEQPVFVPEDVCGLMNDETAKAVLDGVRSRGPGFDNEMRMDPRNPSDLDVLQDMCRSQSRPLGVISGFSNKPGKWGNPDSAEDANTMDAKINALNINPNKPEGRSFYCLLGHGDLDNTQTELNREKAVPARTQAVADRLISRYGLLGDVFVHISMAGQAGEARAEGKEFRRVEIREIDLP